jgi:PAS domain S-box-containing protein
MSWVTIIWSAVASACLTLAGVHFLTWWQSRTKRAELLFALLSVSFASFAVGELAMMSARTPEQFATILRWVHVPTWAVTVSLVGFVRVYLQAGRPWLAWLTCGLRTIALLLNFLVGQNLNYREVTALGHIRFLGESVSTGVGVSNPLMLIGQLSLLLMLIFVADAAISVWRRGDRRRALLTGGSIVFFSLAAIAEAVLVLWQIVEWPLTASIFYLGIVLSMSYEMSRDMLRAAQLSEELHKSQQQLQAILDGAPSLVYVTDPGGRFLLANRAIESMFGVPRENLIGKTSHDLLPTKVADARRALDLDVMARRAPVFNEETMAGPDGIHTYFSVRFPLFDALRSVYGVCGISTDITGHKRAELEFQQQRNELAHLARVMTLSELSGSLAHELNQPLAIILTNAQAAQRLLAQQPPDLAELRDILADIVSEDERAGEVIKRLRALLKPGQTQLQMLSASALVDDVLRIARSDLIERGIRVRTELDGSLPQVMGDRVQLQQVLLNLILNAGDAMAANSPAGRHLTIGTAHRNGNVRVSVSDTGCGLPPDAERVFEAFYTTKKDGLGLGLQICRSIVSAHNGRLWAESRTAAGIAPDDAAAGRGATFHLELPATAEVRP